MVKQYRKKKMFWGVSWGEGDYYLFDFCMVWILDERAFIMALYSLFYLIAIRRNNLITKDDLSQKVTPPSFQFTSPSSCPPLPWSLPRSPATSFLCSPAELHLFPLLALTHFLEMFLFMLPWRLLRPESFNLYHPLIPQHTHFKKILISLIMKVRKYFI